MAFQIKKPAQVNAEARWEKIDNSGAEVLLMPLDNPDYTIGYERLRRRLFKNDAQFGEGEIGVVSGERSEHEGHCLLLANFVIKDWKGALDESGKPIQYTVDNGVAMLKGDPEFFLFTLQKASQLAKDNKEEFSEALGK